MGAQESCQPPLESDPHIKQEISQFEEPLLQVKDKEKTDHVEDPDLKSPKPLKTLTDIDHLNQLVDELKIILNDKDIFSTERCFRSYRCLLESEYTHLLFDRNPRFRATVAGKILEHRRDVGVVHQTELYKLTEELLLKHHDLHMDFNDIAQMDEYDCTSNPF
jgi:collagenase-like PrtC family protease